jgi:type VI secretion system secreted protein VgrG
MLADYVEARLDSPDFSCEHVYVRKLDGVEAISQLFSFELEVVALGGAELDLKKVLGGDATIVYSYQPSGREIRRIHGMIAAVDRPHETKAAHRTYKLTFVPRAFRLTLVETQEIFLDKSIPEIIQEKLARVGLDEEDDVALRLQGRYAKREFVVQYKETDLAFVSRLAEHLGISFHFEHDRGRDTIVFTDHNDGFQPIEGDVTVPFRASGEERDVFEVDERRRLVPGKYMVQEYNHRTPRLDLTAQHDLEDGYAGGVVEYGAHYLTPDEGKEMARIRAEERATTREVLTGRSDVCRLRAGSTFVLEGHPWIGQRELLVVSLEHRAVQVVATHGGVEKEGDRSYTNTFRAIDDRVPYRPPRVTPKPKIVGLVFGLVEPHPEGEIGKHARIDEDGSYTVRFFFDTSGLGSRTYSSLPVRMLQPHAGPNYGHHFPLRPGIEVMVSFVEGDPDRPFIVGAVPNPITPSPVARHNAIMSRIQTASGVLIEMKDV